jgi:large subunit ribosomal protein L18
VEKSLIRRKNRRARRAFRVRKKLFGTSKCPRMSVMKSNCHIAVQLIDDENGVTLASASTMMKMYRGKNLKNNKEAASLIGSHIATVSKEKAIAKVVFDRGFHKYHGVVAALADAARAAGLQF